LRDAAPGFEYVSADPVTIACRAHKSAHELELMALLATPPLTCSAPPSRPLEKACRKEDIAHLIEAGFRENESACGALVLLGASAALPHGTLQPQKLKEGDVVFDRWRVRMEGYASDVTRTSILRQA